jgi:hypothetical protein
MKGCPDTDAMVTIADAMNWEVAEGLRHLQTCEECRTRVEALQLTRAAFTEEEPVEAADVQRISAALGAAAHSERARAHAARRWADAIEAVMAGITAVILLVSGGIEIRSISAALLGFALGATFLIVGRVLARQAAASRTEALT